MSDKASIYCVFYSVSETLHNLEVAGAKDNETSQTVPSSPAVTKPAGVEMMHKSGSDKNKPFYQVQVFFSHT